MTRLWNGWSPLNGVLVAIACAFGFSSTAQAADTVLLKYQSTQSTVSFDEVEAFAADHQDISEPLQAFLDQTPLSTEPMATLLDASIPDTGIPLGDTDIQFLLYQLNKLVGDPLNREDLLPLGQALYSAYLDQDMSMIELAKRYPAEEVRLDLGRLEQVHRDVTLFVQRITPLLNFFDELLPDMVCECEQDETGELSATGSTDNGNGTMQAGQADIPHPIASLGPQQAPLLHKAIADQNVCGPNHPWAKENNQSDTSLELTVPADAIMIADWANSTDEAIHITPNEASTPYTPYRISEDVVFVFGPIQLSFAIADLTTFVETGDVPNGWRTPLRIAKVKPAELRSILTSEVELDLGELDQNLNRLVGEYVLFQLGQLIHTPSRTANIQALRSALILSVANDGKVTVLEFLQNYPAPQLIVESVDVLSLTRNLGGRGAVPTLTGSLEDVLVQIQEAIALEICECNDG